MLGSGGSLVADAVGEGTIPNFSNSAWVISGPMQIGGNGSYIFSSGSGSGSGSGSVILNLNLQPGERYRFSGRFGLSGYASAPKYFGEILVSGSQNTEYILFDTTSKQSINVDKEFVVPDDATQVSLIFLFEKSQCTIDYNSNWKIENTSTDKGILNSIKEGFSKLWEWLQGIWDSIKEIPTKIGQFITALGDRIKTFFTDLVNNMRNFFTSLGDRISGFFNDIWEKIKSFFLPHDGYFDEYSAKFNAFIDEHFGFLAQLPDELSLIINMLVNYTPANPPYIDFPTVKVPIPGHEFTLIQGQKYVFTILTQSPYNMLYSAYQGFVWLAYCLMLFNFLKHKYNVIFGGDGSAD